MTDEQRIAEVVRDTLGYIAAAEDLEPGRDGDLRDAVAFLVVEAEGLRLAARRRYEDRLRVATSGVSSTGAR